MLESFKIRASASARARPAEDKSGSLPPLAAFSACRTITTTGCADTIGTDTKSSMNSARAFMRKSYGRIIPMRLKFAAAFVDQKDEHKLIVLLTSDQKLPAEKRERKAFLLLPSSSLARRSLVRRRLDFPRSRISRYAEVVLVFARSRQKMSNRLLALCRAHHFPFFNRSDDGVIRVYDQTCNVIETHAHVGDFREF